MLDGLIILAAGGNAVDPMTGSIFNLIGGLGSAGAAVFVVWLFLNYLKGFQTEMYKNFEALAERQGQILRDVSDTLREFNRTSNDICRTDSVPRSNRRE